MLLPPDLRDWVPEDDLVHFVIEAVDRLPLKTLRVNHRGTGERQFPPHMMLALLIYSYTNGLFSSRRIERTTHRDVAIRYLCAGTHPNHDTICKFRRENLEAFRAESASRSRHPAPPFPTPPPSAGDTRSRSNSPPAPSSPSASPLRTPYAPVSIPLSRFGHCTTSPRPTK
jgi:hypothetical protein